MPLLDCGGVTVPQPMLVHLDHLLAESKRPRRELFSLCGGLDMLLRVSMFRSGTVAEHMAWKGTARIAYQIGARSRLGGIARGRGMRQAAAP
jgi:hypothetical protein